jgi:hypothetical protein
MQRPLYAHQQHKCAVLDCEHPAMMNNSLCAMHRLYPLGRFKRLPDVGESAPGLVDRILAYVRPQPFRDARGRFARRPPW